MHLHLWTNKIYTFNAMSVNVNVMQCVRGWYRYAFKDAGAYSNLKHTSTILIYCQNAGMNQNPLRSKWAQAAAGANIYFIAFQFGGPFVRLSTSARLLFIFCLSERWHVPQGRWKGPVSGGRWPYGRCIYSHHEHGCRSTFGLQ